MQKITNLTMIYLEYAQFGNWKYQLWVAIHLYSPIMDVSFSNLARLCQSISCLFGAVWQLLHMFIHRLGREIWTQIGSAHCFGTPCMLLMSSQRSFMPKKKKVTEAFLRLAIPLLKVDAADDDDDDGQIGIWKAPLPLGTAELKSGWVNLHLVGY